MKLPHQFINVVSLTSNFDTFVPTPHPQLYQLVIPEKSGNFSKMKICNLCSKRLNPL